MQVALDGYISNMGLPGSIVFLIMIHAFCAKKTPTNTLPSLLSLLGITDLPSLRLNILSLDGSANNQGSWVRDNTTFVYIGASSPANGVLFYMPTSHVQQMTFYKRPVSKLLASNNLIKFLNTGSYINHSFMTAMPPYRRNVQIPSDRSGLKLDDKDDAQPTGTNPPTELKNLKPIDVVNPEHRFILTSELTGTYVKHVCFVDPMDMLIPVDYAHIRTIIFGSDGAEVIMKIGITFASITISMKSAPPVELILSERARNISLIWPALKPYEPVDKFTRRPYLIYLLGPHMNASDMEIKSYINMIESVEESSNYDFQIAQTHAQLFIFAATPISDINDIYCFRVVTTRLFMSLVASVRNAFQSGYISFDEIIKTEANIKMITETLSTFALHSNPGTYFLLSGMHLRNENADIIKSLIRKTIINASKNTASLSILQHLYVLRSAYAFNISQESGNLGEHVSSISLELIIALHEESVRDTIAWNTSARHALYYAFASIFQRPPNEWDASRTARKALLFASSMCTEEHIVATELVIQEMYIKINVKNSPVHILDVYTPCVTALRMDISEHHHRLYAMSDVILHPVIEKYLENDSRGIDAEEELETKAELVITKLKTPLMRRLTIYASEVVTCSDADILEATALLVLPISGLGSYVVTRQLGIRGIVYNVDGVDVNNQLYITYVRIPCTTTAGNIVPMVLPRPLGSDCPYCGCVLLRYSTNGNLRHTIYISSQDLQRELIAGGNSSIRYFNPTIAQIYGTSLLLYPNGTIVRILAFESERVTIISATYVATATAGASIAISIAIITVRMIINNFRYNYHRYKKLSLYDDL